MAINFQDVLSQLHDHHVDFVIVGGVAAALHGGSRVTFDLDVVPSLAQPLKRRAGRPQDLLDIAQLQDIQKRLR